MLKKLVLLLAIILSTSLAFGQDKESGPDFTIEPLPMPDSGELIHLSYLKLFSWTIENGQYSRYKTSQMKYIRLVEIFDSPYIFCGSEVKPPKVRKVFFQVVAKAKVPRPTKEEDIEFQSRIVVIKMEHVDGKIKYTYHVAVDTNFDGLPNEVRDWVEVKDLKGRRLEKKTIEGVELPPEAEIVDMEWGYWLAEFIKLYHLDLMESIPTFEDPDFKEAVLEELYGKESAGRFRHSPMPADQSLLWAGTN